MKKFINLRVLRAIEFLLSIFLAATLFIGVFNDDVGLTLPDSVKYLPVAAAIIIIVLFALEFIKSKPWIRLIYLIIAFLVCLMMSESLEMLNQTIWLFGFIYMILALVSLIRTGTNTVAAGKAEIPYKKCLPVGVFCKRDLIFTSVGIVVFCALIIIDAVLSNVYSFNYWFTVPAIVIVCIAFLVFYFIKFNTLGKLLSRVNKELCFKKFDEELSVLLKNNLHPETSNYLMILRANYLFAYDKTEVLVCLKKFKNRPSSNISPCMT